MFAMIGKWILSEAEMANDSVGLRLKALRYKERMSQQRVADRMKATRQTIISDEKDGDMPLSRLYGYAELYGKSIHDLIP